MNKDLTFWIERKPFVKASKRRYRLWILHNVFPCICDKHKRCSALKVSRKVTAINFSRKNEKISQKPNNEVHDTCFASVYLTLCCQSRRSNVKRMTFPLLRLEWHCYSCVRSRLKGFRANLFTKCVQKKETFSMMKAVLLSFSNYWNQKCMVEHSRKTTQ